MKYSKYRADNPKPARFCSECRCFKILMDETHRCDGTINHFCPLIMEWL